MEHQVLNPISGRLIMINKNVYNNLLRGEYTHDRKHNILVLRQTNYPPTSVGAGGAIMGNVSLIDEEIPDISVELLKPTTYQRFESAIAKNVEKMSNWLWKLVKNRSKNANDIAK